MESTSGRIIRFAWARVLGLADDALAGPSAGVVIRESDSVAMYVRLWDQRVLVIDTKRLAAMASNAALAPA